MRKLYKNKIFTLPLDCVPDIHGQTNPFNVLRWLTMVMNVDDPDYPKVLDMTRYYVNRPNPLDMYDEDAGFVLETLKRVYDDFYYDRLDCTSEAFHEGSQVHFFVCEGEA